MIFVKKAILALLAIVLALHAVDLSCGIAQAQAAVRIPCCDASCPLSSAPAHRTCCQVRNPRATAGTLSARPGVPSLQPLAGPIESYAVLPVTTAFRPASSLPAGPPGAARLALLCSRQI